MTIAQQLGIKEFPFMIRDSRGNCIYVENSSGYWVKREYNAQGKEIRLEDSDGIWIKQEYDDQGNRIYSENSYGTIVDNRPKTELTMDEIAVKFGIPVSQLKIKK